RADPYRDRAIQQRRRRRDPPAPLCSEPTGWMECGDSGQANEWEQGNLRVAPYWKRLVTARRNSSRKAVRLSRIVSTSRFSEGWMRLLAGITGLSGALQMRVLVLTAIGLMSAIAHFAAGEARSEAIGNWAFYAGDAGGSRYSP